MSRKSDEELLTAFASWWRNEGFEDMAYRIAVNIDAFLAASEPRPSVCTANCEHRPTATLAPLKTKWTGNVRVAALPPATEPQECWAVGPTFAPAGHWLCVRVYRDGTHNQYGVPRKTREEAEADGLASGLPRWHEAIPAALPTDITGVKP